MFVVRLDAVEFDRFHTYDEAWLFVLRTQGQSVEYALEFGGWSITEE